MGVRVIDVGLDVRAQLRGNGPNQIVLGAEQWPECLNPITECANSSWYVWTVSFAVMPGLWDTTNAQTFEATDLLASEPVVEVL